MQELYRIASEFEEHYWAEDGLVRLEKWDAWHEPFAGTLKTVSNQNGILWLAEIINEFDRHGYPVEIFKERARFAIDYIRVPGTHTFSRRHGEKVFMDSHDNMLGIVLLCQIFDFDDILQGIVHWGVVHGWSFNNLDPFNEFDIRATRQPNEEALYVSAIGGTPGIVECLWLLGSTAFGELRKLYLRGEILRRAQSRHHRSRVNLLSTSFNLALAIRGGRKKLQAIAREYYKDPDFPYRQLLEMPLK